MAAVWTDDKDVLINGFEVCNSLTCSANTIPRRNTTVCIVWDLFVESCLHIHFSPNYESVAGLSLSASLSFLFAAANDADDQIHSPTARET